MLCHQKLFCCQILISVPAERSALTPQAPVDGLAGRGSCAFLVCRWAQNSTIPFLAKKSWKDLLLQHRVVEIIITLPFLQLPFLNKSVAYTESLIILISTQFYKGFLCFLLKQIHIYICSDLAGGVFCNSIFLYFSSREKSVF